MAKIIATISPDTVDLKGIDIGRINGSFGTKPEIIELAKRIMRQMKVPVLLDLPRHRKKRRTNELTDDDFIEIAKKTGITYLGLSYIASGDEVRQIRAKLKNANISLISKIEVVEAEKNLQEIISASDGIMIDRGDLASEVGFENLPRLQKKIIRFCNAHGKMVIVATEMLASMVKEESPTKAEVMDIANAISDGADYVMLSEETAIGKHPERVISTMRKILDEVSESYKVIILSAGSGTGLGELTATHHVCLTDIGGKTILQSQLESL
ncbi:MAG TPA: pyruvate kinase, partial [Candidatus Margulisiibacteriota bacterium]|nr:pyruvate kinase [Candidatus Margulisiibacteriota bacterium]